MPIRPPLAPQELLRVHIVSPISGQVITWDDSVGQWINLGVSFSSVALPEGQIFIGSALNFAQPQAVTGAISITPAGLTSLNVPLQLSGSISGLVSIDVLDSTGTYTLTLPSDDGTPGQFLQTDGFGVTSWATVTSGVSSITGTANQIIASSPTGAVTLSTPQDIGLTSTVQFGTLQLGSLTNSPATNWILAARQSGNNRRTLILQRQTDTSPTGDFLSFYDIAATPNKLFNVDITGAITVGSYTATSISTTYTDAKVLSVSGTTNRITVSPTTGAAVVDISSSYVGQTSITTLGTIGTGVWQGTSISTTYTDAKVLSVTGTTNRISVSPTTGATIVDIDAGYVGQTSITTLGTIGTGVWQGSSISTTYTDAKVTSIAGTTNQIIASSPTGAVTLSTPQNIDTAATVQFGTVQLGTLANSPASNWVIAARQSANNRPTIVAQRQTDTSPTGDFLSFYDIAATPNKLFNIDITGAITVGSYAATSISTTYTDAKIKTVTGTTNRLSIGGTSTDPTFDISTSYVGQTTITTLGTIGTGTWQSTAVAALYGGTGLTSYAVGDLIYASATTPTLSRLAAVATGQVIISQGTNTAPIWSATPAVTTIAIRDTSAAFDVTIGATSSATLTAGRILTLDMGNVAHTLAFGTTANTITFPSVASDTVVMLAATQTLTGKSIAASQITAGTFAAGTFSFSGSTLTTLGTVQAGSLSGLTKLAVRDTTAGFDVILAATSSPNISADRTLTLDMGNVDHTLVFGTTANTITFPSVASDTVAMLAVAQRFTALQTISLNSSADPATLINPLHIVGADATLSGITMDIFGANGAIYGRHSSGTNASKTATANTSIMFAFRARGYDGSAYTGDVAEMRFIAGETFASGATGTRIDFFTTPVGTSTFTNSFRIPAAGGAQVLASGLQIGSPTGGDKGSGTVNAAGAYYSNNTIGVSAGSFSTITAITSTLGIVTQLTGSSDERLKDVHSTFTKGLDALRTIHPICFSWNERSGFSREAEMVGFSAQNVQSSIPEAIGEETWADGSKWMTLNDRAILAAAVNAIHELEQRLLALEEK